MLLSQIRSVFVVIAGAVRQHTLVATCFVGVMAFHNLHDPGLETGFVNCNLSTVLAQATVEWTRLCNFVADTIVYCYLVVESIVAVVESDCSFLSFLLNCLW